MKTISFEQYFKQLTDTNITFLCASDRIWRSLEAQYNDFMLASMGSCSWQNDLSAHYLPTYLEALHDSSFPEQVCLSAAQEVVVCKRAIDTANNVDAQELSSIGLSKRFRKALSIADTYGLSDDKTYYLMSHEASRYYDWKEHLEEYILGAGYIFTGQAHKLLISKIIAGEISVSKTFCFVGFIEFSPFLLELIAAIESVGSNVQSIEFPYEAAGNCGFVSASTEHHEVRLAGEFLKGELKNNPNGKFALIVPEIDRYRDIIESGLEQVFNSGNTKSEKLWVFAGGRRLNDYPLIAVAVDILLLGSNPTVEVWSRVIRSSFINGYSLERDSRAQLDLKIRAIPKRNISINNVITLAKSVMPSSMLLAQLMALAKTIHDQPHSMATTKWSIAMELQLSAMGWLTNRVLTSSEYQTHSAWYKQVSVFVSMDAQVGKVMQGAAVGWLRELISGKRFEPENNNYCPILILSHWDALCVQFDAAWVIGMNSQEMPKPAQPSPFLPLELQEMSGVPDASQALTLLRNETHVKYLHSVGLKTVFSYARYLQDIEQTPSPIVEGLVKAEQLEYTILPQSGGATLVSLPDEMPPINEHEAEGLRSIVNIIKDSANNSLVSALKNRFKLKAFPESRVGMDAALAGILVQSTLEDFWNVVKTQCALQELSDENLQVQVKSSIDAAFITNSRKVQYIAIATVSLEKARILEVTLNWLEKEAMRTLPFKVIGNEVPATIKIMDREFKLSIDRIEEIEVGGKDKLMYLDHKTGSTINPLGMIPSNMTNPQLPIYTQAQVQGIDRTPDGIALAQVRAGEMRFFPLSSFDTELAKQSKLPPTEELWKENLSGWEMNISKIYTEFTQGSLNRNGAPLTYDEYLSGLIK